MDAYSHMLANRLVGNAASAAALEITLIGPELEVDSAVTCAVAGAAFTLTVEGQPVPMHEAFTLPAGARLRFGERSAGARVTLAVRGGIGVEKVFGSRATSLTSGMGGLGGRALKAGDVLPLGRNETLDAGGGLAMGPSSGPIALLPMPKGGTVLRVMRGPQELMFTAAAYATLFSSRFLLTPSSNRMGYRLEGPRLAHAGRADILSDATPLGSIQVPASGQPILLMADRQTTGGYPKIATVISADIPLAGQLSPGDWIEFRQCSRDEALLAQRARLRRLEGRSV
jgi:antagonist of KipI